MRQCCRHWARGSREAGSQRSHCHHTTFRRWPPSSGTPPRLWLANSLVGRSCCSMCRRPLRTTRAGVGCRHGGTMRCHDDGREEQQAACDAGRMRTSRCQRALTTRRAERGRRSLGACRALFLCTYVCISTYICTYTCTFLSTPRAYTYMKNYTYVSTHPHARTHTHTNTHTTSYKYCMDI
jgi:hypothetical protein